MAESKDNSKDAYNSLFNRVLDLTLLRNNFEKSWNVAGTAIGHDAHFGHLCPVWMGILGRILSYVQYRCYFGAGSPTAMCVSELF